MKLRSLIGIVFGFVLTLSQQSGATCYVNSESHLPFYSGTGLGSTPTTFPSPTQQDAFASCGPSAKNADLNWTPNQAVRRALFDSAAVQDSAAGCDSYGHLLKAECKPDFPVLTIFYPSNNYYRIESFVIERNPSLNAAPELSPEIKNYMQTRLKIPSGDWANQGFLNTVIVSVGDGENAIQMTIIQYVDMMNKLFSRYPTKDYRQAYIDFINGDRNNLSYFVASLEYQRNLISKIVPVILQTLEE